MRALLKLIKSIITLPFRLVWKLRKLIVVGGGATAAYVGYQKRKEGAADTQTDETSAS